MELTTAERNQQNGGPDGGVTLEIVDNIAIVHFNRGENRLNWAFFGKLDDILDQIERNPDIRAVITTGDGRFYSNGLDLNWLSFLHQNAPEKLIEFLNIRMAGLMSRLLTFPLPTIAAINGHCYAGGVLLALSHDYRIMNTEKGWFCLNEVHIKLIFSEISRNIIRSKIPSGMPCHEAAVLGRQYTAKEAEQQGIISTACKQKDLLPTSIALADKLTKRRPYNRATLQAMKRVMYEEVVSAINRGALSKKINLAAQL